MKKWVTMFISRNEINVDHAWVYAGILLAIVIVFYSIIFHIPSYSLMFCEILWLDLKMYHVHFLPYAAWEVCPTTSSLCLNQYFHNSLLFLSPKLIKANMLTIIVLLDSLIPVTALLIVLLLSLLPNSHELLTSCSGTP